MMATGGRSLAKRGRGHWLHASPIAPVRAVAGLRIWRSYLGLTGLLLVLVVVVMAIFAPWIATADPLRHNLLAQLQPPSLQHPFGTDSYGRDVFSRVVWGARASMTVGFLSIALGCAIGLPLGLLSGYFSGKLDTVLSRVIDVMISFPSIMLAITVVGIVGAGTRSVVIALGIALGPRFARLVRGEMLKLRVKEYVEAARASGATDRRIMVRHVLPNAASPIIVMITLYLPYAILVEASLSFLGIGVGPDTPTWGSLIADGRQYMRLAPWISLLPGVAIMVATMGFNLLGDGLRDILDPQLRT